MHFTFKARVARSREVGNQNATESPPREATLNVEQL
jgi:hypothetical protein